MRLAGGLASLRCDYCKSLYYATPDDSGVRFLDEVQELLCPVCSIPLWNANLANVPIHACKKCHGMLVAMGAFQGLIDQARALNPNVEIPVADDGSELDRTVHCPQCHRAMETHFYYGGGHVVMEDCERCELNWLDGGALMRIAHAPHVEDTDE